MSNMNNMDKDLFSSPEMKKLKETVDDVSKVTKIAKNKAVSYTKNKVTKLKSVVTNNSKNISWIIIFILFFLTFML